MTSSDALASPPAPPAHRRLVVADPASRHRRGDLRPAGALHACGRRPQPRLPLGRHSLADGIFSLSGGIVGSAASTGSRWWLAITGVLGIAAGLIAFFAPALTADILLIFIAISAIIIGVMAIIGAIQLRKEIEGEWLLVLSGAIAIIFGILMFTRPRSAALAVVWMIATFAIIFGIDMVMLAFKLRGHKNRA